MTRDKEGFTANRKADLHRLLRRTRVQSSLINVPSSPISHRAVAVLASQSTPKVVAERSCSCRWYANFGLPFHHVVISGVSKSERPAIQNDGFARFSTNAELPVLELYPCKVAPAKTGHCKRRAGFHELPNKQMGCANPTGTGCRLLAEIATPPGNEPC